MVNALSYISIIATVFIFTYIFDVKENYILLYMLLIAPILDFGIFIYYKKNMIMESFVSDDSIEKRENISWNIKIKNEGVIPILFLDYEFTFNEKFICEYNSKERISIGYKKTINREFTIQGMHRGIGEFQLANVTITSVMGLFKSNIEFESTSHKVLITPAIIEVDNIDRLIESTMKDESDDEASNNLFAGEPGYEYKSYAPGDPLNRVNWKLSAKTGDLYIRKNTTDIKRKKILILDPLIENKTNFEDYGDLLIEGIIGVLKELYALDYDSELYYLEEKSLKNFIFEDDTSLGVIKEKFSSYSFISFNHKKRFENFLINTDDPCDFVLFTVNKDEEVENFALELEHSGSNITVISNNQSKVFENELFLSENYELEVL